MIFIFLENENEMVKSLPEMMFGGGFQGDIFLYFLKSPWKISVILDILKGFLMFQGDF